MKIFKNKSQTQEMKLRHLKKKTILTNSISKIWRVPDDLDHESETGTQWVGSLAHYREAH